MVYDYILVNHVSYTVRVSRHTIPVVYSEYDSPTIVGPVGFVCDEIYFCTGRLPSAPLDRHENGTNGKLCGTGREFEIEQQRMGERYCLCNGMGPFAASRILSRAVISHDKNDVYFRVFCPFRGGSDRWTLLILSLLCSRALSN